MAHSLSPLLHTTAFDALGLGDTWCSFAFEVAPGQVAAALADMRRSDVSGLSVTMPHKADVAALVDECSDVARRLNAVNCIVQRDGVLYGTNTDGEGFVASLARGAALRRGGSPLPGGRRRRRGACGRAGLAGAGASQVTVVNRTPERAYEAAALAGPAGTTVAVTEQKALVEAVQAADLVVNATPLGMAGATTLRDAMEAARQRLVPPELLHEGQVAADLVYVPRPTPWLVEAASRGATTLDGLGMLVHQAAAQLLLWTGREPPVHTMWEAAVETTNPNSPVVSEGD